MAAEATLAAAGNDRYEALALLGMGGMGAVYRARDRHSGRVVALKRLSVARAETRRAQLTELFHQEFRTLAQLAHPHVVRAHDFGIDEHGPYYSMELLEGQDLHALSPLPWREACSLMRDVCSAVALLHSRRLLHRDVSPKNIQRTSAGRATLLDFGAMMPMGPSKSVVGTAPLVPPEALMQQALDGRADLYALGGTLYFALTGVHAYSARDTAQLHELWQRGLHPPSALAKDIPAELDALVLALLSRDRMARPRSAAEVIDRLTAIAALAEDDALAVSHAYLATPELAGRDVELTEVRAQIAGIDAAPGAALLLEGAPGMGRSRLLDTTVLEAKLAGIHVARASAADATAPYGTVVALLRSLLDTLQPRELALLGAGGALGLLDHGEISAEVDTRRRSELQSVIASVLRACARTQSLLLAVDDLERCDEPSLAALASAVEACRKHRVLLVATFTSGSEHDTPAIALLCEDATRIELAPFRPEDTEALLGSVFGEVPNLQGVAARIHACAEGSPRGCMELAQYLNEHGLVHYEMGSWVLPAELDAGALPSSLSRARRIKLEALSPDARELSEALAVAEGSGLDFEAYFELTAHADRDRVRSALDELLLARVLRVDGVTYAFEAQVWVAELLGALDDERARALNARVAAALERRACDRLDAAYFSWRAGNAAHMVELLLAELALGSRWDRHPREYAAMLQHAAAACRKLGRSPRDHVTLLTELMRLGHNLALPGVLERLRELYAQLREDSGLGDWERLDPELPAPARLQRALELAQARYDAAKESERGLPPIEAIIALTRLMAESSALAAQTGDLAMFESAPSLEPFVALAPAIERVHVATLPAARHVIAGRYEPAIQLYREQLTKFRDNVIEGIDDRMRHWAICALHYGAGSIEAGHGRKQAFWHAEELEKAPGWVVPAWTVRLSYYVILGNLREAERCRRRIELLRLQSAVKPPFAAGAVHQHIYAFSIADDITGMRRAIPEMDAIARVQPAFWVYAPFARAELARMCGSYEEALAQFDVLMQAIEPGEHPLWPWIAGGRLNALIGLDRLDIARADGTRDLALAREVGLEQLGDHVEMPLALVEAKCGDFASACRRVDRIIAEREELGLDGVVLGWVFEARARIAAWMGDEATFEHHAQLCARQYKKTEGEPAFAAKYERLMQEARSSGIAPRSETLAAVATDTTYGRGSTTDRSLGAALTTVHAALAACATREQRMRRVLDLLLADAGARDGELYVCGASGLEHAAATREALATPEMLAVLARLADSAKEEADTMLQTCTLSFSGPPSAVGAPASIWPIVLICSRSGRNVVVGVATLHFESSTEVRLPFEIAGAAAAALLDSGDVAAAHTTSGPTKVSR
jgi:hypothetical protein